MASAWGKSWGRSWGNSWGIIATQPTKDPDAGGVRRDAGRRRYPFLVIEEQSDQAQQARPEQKRAKVTRKAIKRALRAKPGGQLWALAQSVPGLNLGPKGLDLWTIADAEDALPQYLPIPSMLGADEDQLLALAILRHLVNLRVRQDDELLFLLLAAAL